MSIFGVILVRIFPHSELFWSVFSHIWIKITPNMDTFYAVHNYSRYTVFALISVRPQVSTSLIIAAPFSTQMNISTTLPMPLREKSPYSEFFWSVFSHIRTEYGRKRLRIQTLFTQCASPSNKHRT